ncbi:hypothetical protein ACEWY4_008102 [Coilia grayii]|uniref:G-protein coupled receptors family 1 profile domain-containing protein n=1 Tax=Coilia grayii TaxID=363190 RepID=A0ABD1K9W0_9TELE
MAACISWSLKNQSSFVMYLKNLVAADLLMTFLIPLRSADGLPGAPQGLQAFNCQFGSVLFYLCMYISIVLMGVISLDHFFKIVQPGGKLLGQSALFGTVVSAVIWVVLLSTVTVPTMVLTSEKPQNSTEFCMAMKNDLGKQVIESFRNSGSKNTEGKRRTKARVFIVLVVFLVCFAPYHIARLPYLQRQMENNSSCLWASHKAVNIITLLIATANVCLDPLIYFLLCKAFREKLCEVKLLQQWFTPVSQVSGMDAEN